MAEIPGTASNITNETTTVTVTEEATQQEDTVRVKLKKPKTAKQVKWITGTVDNENMNKKKSKCCCIYKKPRKFGDSSSSSSDSDDECEHCHGHKDGHKLPVPVPVDESSDPSTLVEAGNPAG